MPDTLSPSRTHTSTHSGPRWLRGLAVTVVAAVVVVQFARLCVHQKGDYDVHWESGRRLRTGEPLYAPTPHGDPRGHNYPYPPFWALVHAPLSTIDVHTSQLLVFPLVVAAGAVLICVLKRLTRTHWDTSPEIEFWVTMAALLLAGRFLVRDMPECGVNLALVALSWAAVWCWTRRREWFGGGLLGLAISLKCTPALFLAWFVWKRQWKMAAVTISVAFVLTASPALFMGPAAYADAMTTWVGNAWRGVGESDPSMGVLGPEPVQNMSLRPALARYLMQLPEGHAMRVDHPAYVDFLSLSPKWAGVSVKVLMLSLVVAVAWCFRQPVRDRNCPALLWEAATVSLMILLLSPITWGQHCVGVLPVLYLIVRRRAAGMPLPHGTTVAMAVYIVSVLLLNRTMIGRDWTYLLDSYHITTWCLLALTGVSVCARLRATAPAVGPQAARQPVGGQWPMPGRLSITHN